MLGQKGGMVVNAANTTFRFSNFLYNYSIQSSVNHLYNEGRKNVQKIQTLKPYQKIPNDPPMLSKGKPNLPILILCII